MSEQDKAPLQTLSRVASHRLGLAAAEIRTLIWALTWALGFRTSLRAFVPAGQTTSKLRWWECSVCCCDTAAFVMPRQQSKQMKLAFNAVRITLIYHRNKSCPKYPKRDKRSCHHHLSAHTRSLTDPHALCLPQTLSLKFTKHGRRVMTKLEMLKVNNIIERDSVNWWTAQKGTRLNCVLDRNVDSRRTRQ